MWAAYVASQVPNAQLDGPPIACFSWDRRSPGVVNYTINQRYASHCVLKNRPHRESRIIVAIDLILQRTYLMCWDRDCRGKCNLNVAPPMIVRLAMEKLSKKIKRKKINV